MQTPQLARVAGESFTLITGLDLAAEQLVTTAPPGFVPGPTEDPEDDDVTLDPDEHLPFPDVPAVQGWWARRGRDLSPRTRHLLGRPATDPAWLAEVLRTGKQRHRAAAAIEMVLRAPGAPLFEVRAPGFRQRIALGGE
jgi:uncharacterized protein (TIGR02270 family)